MKSILVTAGALAVCAMAFSACSSSEPGEGSTLPGPEGGVGDGGGEGDGSAAGGGGAGGANGGMGGGFEPPPPTDGGGGDANCGESPFGATRKQVNILLLIDKSGSMEGEPPGFSTDKWSAMTTALGAAVGAAEDGVVFGLELFPASSGDCSVPSGGGLTVGIGANSTSAIETALGGTTPSGLTPTAQALERALAYYTDGDGAVLEGDKYVLLATDGGPNCDPEKASATTTSEACEPDQCTTNLEGRCVAPGIDNCCDPEIDTGAGKFCLDADGPEAQITALADAGILTFVVGIPGSEDYADVLDALAVAGGVPLEGRDTSYFAVSASGGVEELTTVLSGITTELIRTCELQLNAEPDSRALLNVDIDGRRLNRDEDGPDGWRLQGPRGEPPTVVIQGADCDALKQDGAESINVIFGCPSQMVR